MGSSKHEDLQSEGRKANAAEPLDAHPDNAGAERYPEARTSVERPREGRSFDGEGANPEPRQGAGDGGPDPSVNQGHMGPGGDPAEGKR